MASDNPKTISRNVILTLMLVALSHGPNNGEVDYDPWRVPVALAQQLGRSRAGDLL